MMLALCMALIRRRPCFTAWRKANSAMRSDRLPTGDHFHTHDHPGNDGVLEPGVQVFGVLAPRSPSRRPSYRDGTPGKLCTGRRFAI